jgi:hypothetical protein
VQQSARELSSRHPAASRSGCRESQTLKRRRGVKHQGLVDDRRYQARLCSHGRGGRVAIVLLPLPSTEPSQGLGPRRGAPGGIGRAHGSTTVAVVRGTETPPAKRSQFHPWGASGKNSPPAGCRRHRRRARSASTSLPPTLKATGIAPSRAAGFSCPLQPGLFKSSSVCHDPMCGLDARTIRQGG